MPVGSRNFATKRHERESSFASDACRWEILVTIALLAPEFRSCESTMGPATRVYFTRQSKTIVLLLIGGDKRTQKRDIEQAKNLVRDL
jgi:hypothetical protein